MHTFFLLGNLNGVDHPEDLGVGGKVNIIMDLREIG
jgi:hypothetical protein